MSKLFKLKNWLTVEDSAQYLSIAFGEKISAIDMLQFALDKRIKVSVYIRSRVPTKPAEIYPLPKEFVRGQNVRCARDWTISKRIDRVYFFEGALDLPMIEFDRSIIEEVHRLLRVGEPVEISSKFSKYDNEIICVEKDGQLYVLQQRYEHLGENENSDYMGEEFEEAQRLSALNSYFDAQTLPLGSILVFRTDALREFELSINDTSESVEKPITAKERNTLLIIIAALAKEAKIDLTKSSKASEYIAHLTELIGAAVDHSTIEQKIKQIPNALESRNKQRNIT